MNIPKLSLPQWQKRERVPEPAGVTPLWLVKSAHTASWTSAAIAAFFMWAFCLDIAGDQAEALHVTHAGTWIGDIEFFFPLVIGFAMIAFGIPYVAKNIIAIFVSFSWRGQFWPKLWSLFLVIATSVVLIAGSFSVMGGAIIEHGRGAAVAEQEVMQDRAALQAQIDAEQADLRGMMNNSNAYMAQAANVGAEQWQAVYIAQAKRTGDARLPMIERALGAAVAADQRRANIKALRVQMAKGTTLAAVTATPTTTGTHWIAQAIDFVKGAWALMLSVLNDIICLLMGWIALRLEQKRNAELAAAPAEPDVYMIEDHSAEAVPASQPYTQATEQREQFFDEEGNRIVRRRATFARVPAKRSGKKAKDGKPDLTEYEAPAKSSRLNEEYENATTMSPASLAMDDDGGGDRDQAARDDLSRLVADDSGDAGIGVVAAEMDGGHEDVKADQRLGSGIEPQAVAEMEDGLGQPSMDSASVASVSAENGETDAVVEHAALSRGASYPSDQSTAGHAVADAAPELANANEAEPITLPDEMVDALSGAGLIKDGDLPDQFIKDGELDAEAVREHMATERGLPAPKEDAEAA